MFRLDGRRALVTGAGQGIGAGIASALAAQGAHVLVNDLREERARAVADTIDGAAAIAFDVTDLPTVTESAARIERDHGPVDILVNNAGNAGEGRFVPRPFAEMPPGDWAPFLEVNLAGVLNCTHAHLPGMIARGWGRIVTISSDAGRIGFPPGVSVYGAAKAAAAQLMRYLATENGSYGVTANVIALGHMNSIAGEFAEQIVRQIPVGRLGAPRDAAAAVVFLASDEAAWITGATLAVNGGFPAI